MKGKELYLRLLSHVRPYWKAFAVSIVTMMMLAATEPAIPALLKPLLDGSFVQKDRTYILIMPLAILALSLIRGITSFLSTVSMAWVSGKLILDLRNHMFDKMLALPTKYYDDHSSGIMLSKVTFDVSQVTAAATHVLTVIVKDTLTLLGLLGFMFYLNWKLALVALVVTPVMAVSIRVISKRLRAVSRAQQKSMGKLTHILDEALSGNRIVKIFGGQSYEKKRFTYIANWVRRYGMKATTASAANVPVVEFMGTAALALIIYLASLQSALGHFTVGSFVAFFTAMAMLFSPMKRLTGINAQLQAGLAAAESVFEVMDEHQEPDEGTQHLDRARGELTFDHVHFSYAGNDDYALHDVSLQLAPGETIALVGPSGGGKSTFVNLIPRFYNVDSGRILLDGIDIRDLKLADLRANISLVSQEVVLFNDTVAANIAYGQTSQATEADIVAAAEAAHAMEFIRDMPDGLQTEIGERGVRLSGGQRQRLAIARALLKNAPLLILDEATSALDSQSERHVQAALEALMKNRTTIVIAHRLSTIENADRIVVLQKGRIVETGSHDALIGRDGLYAKLHRIQFADNAAAEVAL